MTLSVPAIVIGTGIAGLFTALKLAEAGVRVLLLTKTSLGENNSKYAQGGIAAVLPQNAADSIDLHVADTLRAGDGLVDAVVARSILSEGFAAIEDLLSYGVPFDRAKNHMLAVTQEAAHSVKRIIHAGGDATGASVELSLINQVQANPRISVMDYARVVELLLDENGACAGCVTLYRGSFVTMRAAHVVLATGGAGQLYLHTTNPPIATGDGLMLAHHIGAPLRHLEFVQFHPTAFYQQGEVRFLISEALRGEGGRLVNGQGESFIEHPDAELAPRDVVTRAIFAEMHRTGTPNVFLDMTHLPASLLESRFPTILHMCLQRGVDLRREWIPVSPAAHYMMGGVAVDAHGLSQVPRLYTVGEAACTGLHGANRLASNSLLECVVLGRRVASHIAGSSARMPALVLPPSLMPVFNDNPLPQVMANAWQELRACLWHHVGILRTETGLLTALNTLDALEETTRPWDHMVPWALDVRDSIALGRLITQAALLRQDSVGAHCRMDTNTPVVAA